MAHAIRSEQVRSPVAERTQPKPRLVSALKTTSILPTARPFDERAGFTYYQVQVVYENAGLKQSYPGVLDECLALELKEMLESETAPYPVRVLWTAGWANEFEDFPRMNVRVTDMILSVRSAERPGHEFQARLGLFGPYNGYAPQNNQSENVAPNLVGVQP